MQESQGKIKTIREGNFEKVMKVSDKQIKLTYLIAKKKRLDYTLELAVKLKYELFYVGNIRSSSNYPTLFKRLITCKHSIVRFLT